MHDWPLWHIVAFAAAIAILLMSTVVLLVVLRNVLLGEPRDLVKRPRKPPMPPKSSNHYHT